MNAPVLARTELAQFLETNKQQIAAALPKHLNPDRMCRLAMTAFSQNKALRDCNLNSIFASVVIASQLGLEIGVAGQGYLVPYKGKCSFIPGWQGLVDLVSRSGRATVWTGAVYEGDDFDWALGDRPFVKHKPRGRDRDTTPTHTYSIGRAKGSDWPIIEVWEHASLLHHRDKYNKVGDKHYSLGNWEMYARKVPLLQVIKYLPKSIELANAIALESAYAEGKSAVLEGDFVRIDDDAQDGDPAKTSVEQPKAKTDSAAPANASTSSSPEGIPNAGGNGAAPDHGSFQPMKPSQVSIVKAKLRNAGLTEIDLGAGFPDYCLEPKEGKQQFAVTQFADVTTWIEKNAKG